MWITFSLDINFYKNFNNGVCLFLIQNVPLSQRPVTLNSFTAFSICWLLNQYIVVALAYVSELYPTDQYSQIGQN